MIKLVSGKFRQEQREHPDWLHDLKERYRRSQIKVSVAANTVVQYEKYDGPIEHAPDEVTAAGKVPACSFR